MSPGLDDYYSSNMKPIFTVLCIYAGNQNVSLPRKYTVFKKISRKSKKVVREACPWDKMAL
jgi:hypothetical protein